MKLDIILAVIIDSMEKFDLYYRICIVRYGIPHSRNHQSI